MFSAGGIPRLELQHRKWNGSPFLCRKEKWIKIIIIYYISFKPTALTLNRAERPSPFTNAKQAQNLEMKSGLRKGRCALCVEWAL